MFPPGFTCPAVLWILIAASAFRIRDFHPVLSAFPCCSAKLKHTHFSPNPDHISTIGLASSAFARHYLRNLGWFLFLALLRCFSSGGSPHIPMDSVYDDRTWLLPDCSIRKSMDQSLLTTPHGISLLAASFIGSQCQGIPLVPFVAWPCDYLGSFCLKKSENCSNITFAFSCKLIFVVFLSFYFCFLISLFSFQSASEFAAFALIHFWWA